MKFTYRDLAFAFLSAFLGSVMGYLISQTHSLGAVQVFGMRCIGTTCFILPVIAYNSDDIWYDRNSNLNLLLRSVAACVAVCGYYYGFVYLTIAEASLLFYSTPIFTIVIGHFFLEEHCALTEVVATALSICGVCAVCFPQLSFNYSTSALIGIAGSLTGALGEAVCLATTRKITHVPPFAVGFWWSVVGILLSVCLGGLFGDFRAWQCGWEAAYLFSVAFVGFVSEVSLVTALKSTDAIIVSLALTSEILWAFLIQFFVGQEDPSLTTIIGGILIGISLLLPPAVKLFSTTQTEYKF